MEALQRVHDVLVRDLLPPGLPVDRVRGLGPSDGQRDLRGRRSEQNTLFFCNFLTNIELSSKIIAFHN